MLYPTRIKSIILACLASLQITVVAQPETRIRVSGTHCTLSPPADFTPAKNFTGFQHDASGSSIMVAEIPGPYAQMAAGFTEDALRQRGMTMLYRENVMIGQTSGLLLGVKQSAYGVVYLKNILLFGDSALTVVVNGIIPQAHSGMEAAVKNAVLSIEYQPESTAAPLEGVLFQISPEGTNFLLARSTMGTLLYTLDGKVPTLAPEKAMFLISNSISKVNPEDKMAYATERLRKLPRGESMVIESSNSVQVAGMPGTEIIAFGNDSDGRQQLTYFVMLFDDNSNYFLMVGSTLDNFETHLAAFRRMTGTFQLK